MRLKGFCKGSKDLFSGTLAERLKVKEKRGPYPAGNLAI